MYLNLPNEPLSEERAKFYKDLYKMCLEPLQNQDAIKHAAVDAFKNKTQAEFIKTCHCIEQLISSCEESICLTLIKLFPWQEGYPFVDYNSSAPTLHTAVTYEFASIIRYLVEECHVPVNERGKYGDTALHDAAATGNEYIIRYLIEKGADPLARTDPKPPEFPQGKKPSDCFRYKDIKKKAYAYLCQVERNAEAARAVQSHEEYGEAVASAKPSWFKRLFFWHNDNKPYQPLSTQVNHDHSSSLCLRKNQ